MIIMYKGGRGRGKTLTMVKDGLIYYKEGYHILRNFTCNFGQYISNEEILDLDKDSNLNNCVLMIDEIQIFFDSRGSMLKQNKHFSNFIQQIRKRNIIILCTTQYSNTIDLRIRQHLDIIAYPNFKKVELYDQIRYVCEVTYLDLTRLQDNDYVQDFKPSVRKIVYDAEPIFNVYDTSEMIA